MGKFTPARASRFFLGVGRQPERARYGGRCTVLQKEQVRKERLEAASKEADRTPGKGAAGQAPSEEICVVCYSRPYGAVFKDCGE